MQPVSERLFMVTPMPCFLAVIAAFAAIFFGIRDLLTAAPRWPGIAAISLGLLAFAGVLAPWLLPVASTL